MLSVAVEACQPLLFSPAKTPGSHLLDGWKGFAPVFIDTVITPEAWLEGFCLSFYLIVTPKARVVLVIFRKHRK